MFRLENKIAFVTGAGSGIGESIARVFAEAGAFVYVAERDATAGANTVESIHEAGHEAALIELDVADKAACASAAKGVLDEKGRLDVLVNNAGIGSVGTVLETEPEDMDRMYSVNVKGVYHTCSAFLPQMIERGSGSVVNLASIGGVVAVRDRFAYCMTKFAVVGMTKAMALDHAKTGVRVNCICPGRVETPFVAARLAEYPDPVKAREEMTETQPCGRMGRPDEIAYAAVYLACDESSFMTGSEFIIDGGWSAG
jgi:NAD(P)-dependent dehydrogenase (short-subunit alcohol dehydrogenase family)